MCIVLCRRHSKTLEFGGIKLSAACIGLIGIKTVAMNIEQEIQNTLYRNFTRGFNAKALKELLVLYNVVEQSEQFKCDCRGTNHYKKNEM